MLFWQWQRVRDDGPITTMAGMVRVDGFGVFLGVVVARAPPRSRCCVAVSYLKREEFERPEYLALMLFSALGMLVMTTANNLIVVFVALEILSIPLYVLAAFDRRRLSSQEAGIKYFVLGAFSSAIFLYGIALVYGATGTTSLTGIVDFLAQNTLVRAGHAARRVRRCCSSGLGFKVVGGAVPHVDARRLPGRAHAGHRVHGRRPPRPPGSPRCSAIFSRRVPAVPRPTGAPWSGCSPCSRSLVGSIGTVLQTDIKRMLAYSSIAHAGLRADRRSRPATPQGREAALFYLFVYSFMVIGSFAVVTALSLQRRRRPHASAATAASRSATRCSASLLVFFMLAQAGIPLTGGFIAKVEVFEAATAANEYALVVIGAVATVIASFGYLRVALSVAYPDAAGAHADGRAAPPLRPLARHRACSSRSA